MNIKHFELTQIANDFLVNYDMELTIPIQFNTRLKKVLGRFISSRKAGPIKIEMSVDFIQSHPKEHIIDVFKHELVHYALCHKGLPFDDGHPVFERELLKHSIKSTHSYEYLGEVHRYTCEQCNKTFDRKRKLVKTAFCGCSKGPNLKYEGTVMKKLENMIIATGQGLPLMQQTP